MIKRWLNEVIVGIKHNSKITLETVADFLEFLGDSIAHTTLDKPKRKSKHTDDDE